jgi:hypothetical protein
MVAVESAAQAPKLPATPAHFRHAWAIKIHCNVRYCCFPVRQILTYPQSSNRPLLQDLLIENRVLSKICKPPRLADLRLLINLAHDLIGQQHINVGR